MEFWAAVAVLRRRWYVFVPTLMVFALLAAFLVGSVKPVYKASGTIGFLQTNQSGGSPGASTPSSTVTTTPTASAENPYLQMDRIQFQNIMATYAMDSTFRDALVAAGASGSYTVEPPFGNTPLITLSATAPTEAEALASYKILVDQFSQMVVDRQREDPVNAPESQLYRGVPGPMPSVAYPQNGARTKGVIVVALLGFLAAVGLSFLVDSLLAARARRREPGEPPGELVSLIPNPRSPLDDLSTLDGFEDPDPKAGGSGAPMRW
ncbi:MAG: hypothetical protein ACXWCM_17520 [Acidimicrobiales bacterium]